MNRHTAALFASCLALASVAAGAQNLNKAEEGRTAVAQCYARCVDRSERTRLAAYARFDRLTDLLISDEYHALQEESQDTVIDGEKTYICLLGQDLVRSLDACQAGCADLEEAYGVRSSHARNRFRDLLDRESAVLREVGLWSDYRSSPAGGSAEFDRACRAYWNDGASGSASTAPNRTRLLPAPLAGGRRVLQRKEPRQNVLGEEAQATVR